MRRSLLTALAAALALPIAAAHAQFGFTDAFKPAEFAARRAKVMEKIGDGVAIIQGSAEFPGFAAFRQNAQFHYLTGVAVPRAMLIIDGKAKRSTLILPAKNERAERSEGPLLSADEQGRQITGVEAVLVRDSALAFVTRIAKEGRPLYAPFRSESRIAGATAQSKSFDAANAMDPFDGRVSREEVLVAKLKAISGKDVQDLDPILDRLRMIKSPAEIAVLREATRIAELGIMEGIRSARPGMYEYELAAAADYEFRRHGAQGFAYFALVSTGTNAAWPHYHETSSKIGNDEMVLFDYAPDYKYYQSDVTREFPSSGKFSAREREMYVIYLRLYQAIMTSIKTKTAPRDIIKEAGAKMEKIMATYKFTDPKIKEAAERFVKGYTNAPPTRNTLGHMVGMETHDVSQPFDVLEPGMIFTIEPALTIPDEHIYIRLEDMLLITPTGYELLSGMAPEEPEAIEKLMREQGIGKRDKIQP